MLSPIQINIILDSLKQYGEMPLAAAAAGITLRMLHKEMNEDEDLAENVEHARGVFGSTMVLLAQQRAAAGSDTMLKTLLEARVPDFSRESRQAAPKNAKPVSISIRRFDLDEDGEVEDAEAKEPTEPLQLELRRGL